MGSPVEIERRGDVALLRLNRAGANNAMDELLLDGLAESVGALAGDEAVRAIVVAGGEGAFSAGGDLRWIADHPRGAAAAVRILAGRLHEAVIGIRRMRKPVVAAVRGAAAGAGMSLALACDLRVMGRGARLLLAYTSRGLSLDGGASFSLPRLVGLARAIEIAALDEPIDAERALAWGLTTFVVDDDRVLDEALALAARLATRSVHAFGSAKRLLVESFGTPLETQLEREREVLEQCASHPDGIEGLAAFREKRIPDFRSRRREEG